LKKSKTSKTDSQDKSENIKTEPRQHQDKNQDNIKTEPKDSEKPTVVPYIASEPMSSDMSEPSESDLKKEQEKTKKMLLATQLLESGFSVRDVSRELKLSKSLVERASKKVNRETSSRPRQEYMEQPFKKALEESEADESLLSTGWFEKTYRRLLRMRIEFKMMQNMGLLGEPDGNASQKTQKIDVNGLLFAKAISGSGSNKEILELLATLKTMGLLGNSQQANAFETYTKIQELEKNAIEQHSKVEEQAFARAEANATKNLIVKTIDKFGEPLMNLGKGMLKPPNIPNPTMPQPMNPVFAEPHSGILPPNPNPTPLENLTLPSIPKKTPIIPQQNPVIPQDPDHLGYSNLSPLNPAQSKKAAEVT